MESFFVGPDGNPDKYQLSNHVGGGGEATLWKASVTLAGGEELVAVKMLRIDHLGDIDRWRARWQEQVDLLRLVARPGVVGVHDSFEGDSMHPRGRSGSGGRALYLVMNWVEGVTLQDWVLQGPATGERFRHLGQVAEILDALHGGQATPSGRPVVHGDITPANIIIDRRGQATLVDFGLFRVARHVTEFPAGTPGYHAPEVARSGEYSPAADKYSFGALTYFVLTGGHRPSTPDAMRHGLAGQGLFEGDDPLAWFMAILDDNPERRPEAGAWLRGLRGATSTALPRSGPLPPPSAHSQGTEVLRPPAPGSRTGGWLTPGRKRALVALGVIAAANITYGAFSRSSDRTAEPADSTGTTATVTTPSGTTGELPASTRNDGPRSLIDMAVIGEDSDYDIGPSRVDNKVFPRTLISGANNFCGSYSTWDLGRVFTKFDTAIGLDDKTTGSDPMVFRVWLDGEQHVAETISVGEVRTLRQLDVTGVSRIALDVDTDCASGNGVWINPTIS
ncbi:protein kinase [Saccharothrix sp. 6-C]|uniref:protein kinase domain-containing protein n=1 Tax=Saccharothrix sp. 6-C TaxID=2781735 RepID=UPI00191756B4|nr:protein kinase [Saccharothrix sp. 6-C]QQQ74176.1 protein kinase [Saccharothrix sp. 6-C]